MQAELESNPLAARVAYDHVMRVPPHGPFAFLSAGALSVGLYAVPDRCVAPLPGQPGYDGLTSAALVAPRRMPAVSASSSPVPSLPRKDDVKDDAKDDAKDEDVKEDSKAVAEPTLEERGAALRLPPGTSVGEAMGASPAQCLALYGRHWDVDHLRNWPSFYADAQLRLEDLDAL